MTNSEKLQKVLARMGLGSRREIEKWIDAGRVQIDERLAKLGDRVSGHERIRVDGRVVDLQNAEQSETRILLYNKPEGEVCSRKDPDCRKTVFDRLPKLTNERWVAVGRLDINTTGLLLFTTDGELAHKLMHPSSNIEREYLVRVLGHVTPEIVKTLLDGVMLDDGIAQFTDIVENRGEGANRWYYVCLAEGKNREVRRLWESQGIKVNRLKRVRYGPVFMPSRLKLGQWEYLPQKEADVIYTAAGLKTKRVKSLLTKQKEQQERQRGKAPRR